MSLKLFPYKLGSLSAKRLARTLGILRVSPSYNARRKDVIVNWGNSNPPHFRWMEQDLNKPQEIALACDKRNTFHWLEQHGFTDLPIWTTSRQEAYELMGVHNKPVYCRQTVTGHSGRGIVIATNNYELVDAPLYTLATKHKDEYRVHVFKGEAIDIQQKRKSFGRNTTSSGIRNHTNGWVYTRDNCNPPSDLVNASIKAVELLGLDFGAVDIGHRLRDNKFFVFEVNTAPGLEGTTLQRYANAIKNYYRSL
jgi:glutathione synthase/RimK-type ligase-like ATP-grasp enzyme